MRTSHILSLALAMGGAGMAMMPQAQAQSRQAVREQAEASMVLTGEIDIGTEGQVEGFRMDKRDQVHAGIAGFVEETVRTWRFQPVQVDGKAVQARSPVSIRLGGRINPDGTQKVTLLAASFERYDDNATDSVTRLKLPPPAYPEDVYYAGGRGDVLLLLQIGRDGKVLDVATEQVNLRTIATEPNMRRMRDKLSRVSMGAARKWTFKVPTTGEDKDDASWTVRVPVRFAFNDGREERYGKWDAYIPGPRQQAPWRADKALLDDDGDLLPAGGVFMADAARKGPRLLTPLGG
ncbi:energy transducer TonB [Stenotrophomonas sp.]|uniref:energy transducer TonB n=1 Tax=Stenotrophomonas sp. TaxID=69392 RepID=UPI002FCB6E30